MSELDSSLVLEASRYFHKEYSWKVRALGYELISEVTFYGKSFQILALIEYRPNRTQQENQAVLGLIPAKYQYKNVDVPVLAEIEPSYSFRMAKKPN